jgi:hypothetical protein
VRRLSAVPVLYWGLPILAFCLGAIVLMASGQHLGCRCGPPGVQGVLVGLYFTVFGLVAMVARWRGARDLADGGLLVIGFGAAMLLTVHEAGLLVALQRPLQSVSGQLLTISANRATRRHEAGATLVLEGGRTVTWSCGGSCRGRDSALQSLRRDTPTPVQMQVAENRLVGLTANGVQILDSQTERSRQFGEHVVRTGFCGLVLAGLVLFGYFRWRRPMATYTRPPATVLPTLRRPRP